MIDEGQYLNAIARRNTTWARMRDAEVLLAIARDEIRFHDLQDYIRNFNDCQYDYEHAHRGLIRARVSFRAALAEAA